MGRGKLGESGEIPARLRGARCRQQARHDGGTGTTLESWAVAEALASLCADHREVLVETFYRGRSVAEAAAILGISAGTVKSRTFHALKALKLALQERGSVMTQPIDADAYEQRFHADMPASETAESRTANWQCSSISVPRWPQSALAER
jgi:hypothetical protein